MDLVYILVPVVAVGFLVFFILLPRYGPHYTSRLVCPNCKKAFNFHWVPGATLASLRFGNRRRRLKCPYCGRVNAFDIASTRVVSSKVKPKA
jgi:phage FluMu protein Com